LGLILRSILLIDNVLYPKFVGPAVAFLPAALAYGVALIRADILWKLRDDLRAELEYRMTVVLGDHLTPIERNRAARDLFRMRSCERIDQARLLGSGKLLLSRVEIRGQEHLNAAMSQGKGALLCSAHFGSPTCSYSVVGALGFPVTLVARWSYPKDNGKSAVRRFINRLASNVPFTSHLHRPNIIRKEWSLSVAYQAAIVLRQNEVVGILLDAVLKPGDPSKPVAVNFLSHKAVLVPGAVTLAQITGAPLLIMLLRRSNDFRHLVLEISPPIHIDTDAAGSFQRCLAVLEAAIRRYPAQWTLWDSPDLVRMDLVPQSESGRVRRWQDWAVEFGW
jgi:KDO2-lipid IV(A) lauroyltransferase